MDPTPFRRRLNDIDKHLQDLDAFLTGYQIAKEKHEKAVRQSKKFLSRSMCAKSWDIHNPANVPPPIMTVESLLLYKDAVSRARNVQMALEKCRERRMHEGVWKETDPMNEVETELFKYTPYESANDAASRDLNGYLTASALALNNVIAQSDNIGNLRPMANNPPNFKELDEVYKRKFNPTAGEEQQPQTNVDAHKETMV